MVSVLLLIRFESLCCFYNSMDLSFFINLFSDLYEIPTNPPSSSQSSISTTTQKIIVAPQKGSKNIGLDEPKVSSQRISTISQTETKIEDVGVHLNERQKSPDRIDEAKVDVSIDMIYLILIGED